MSIMGIGSNESTTGRVEAAFALVAMLLSKRLPALESEFNDVARKAHAAQSSSIIAGIIISAALLVGIFVVASINSALPTIQNSDLSTARNQTVGRIGDAMLIGSVVVIVLFAAIILRVLRSL